MNPVQPKSASELFDTLIPQGLQMFPDKAREIGSIYGFKISGDGGGDWQIDLTANPPTCTKMEPAAAQCTMLMASADFNDLLADPTKAMDMYFNQKLQITGDVMLAMKLNQLLTDLVPQA